MQLRFVLTTFLTVLLSACVSSPPPEPLSSDRRQLAWAAHQAQLRGVETWTLAGKIAVKTPEDSFSANIHWKQDRDSYRILLTNFLGTTLLSLEGGEGHAQLTLDEQTHYAHSSEALLHRMTGWQLPVAALRYWMLGMPQKTLAAEPVPQTYQLNEQGLLAQLSGPNQWQLDYASYVSGDSIPGFDAPLPKKLTLQHNQVKIKIVASKWTLN